MSGNNQGVIWKLVNFALIAALVCMVGLVFLNAFLRYAFNSGLPSGEELSRYLFVWVSALGAIVAFREGKHIGVDFLVSTLKGTSRKVVVATGCLITLICFVMVLWGGWEFFLTSAASPGPATEIPFGFVSASIMVVAVAVIAMTLKDLMHVLRAES